MRSPFCLLAVAITWGCFADQDGLAQARPNIVLIMTDDQGYWDTGATGNPHIDTPNMDRIAAEGVQFKRFYVAPVCAPTRAGVMTGRYYLRTGLYNTRFGGDTLGKVELTVAQLLKRGGYRTGLFGKWHLGKYPGYQPQHRGFDEFFGHYHGHIERYHFPDQVFHNGKPVEVPNPDKRWSVSDQRWKLVGMFGVDAKPDPSQWSLFDLHADPGEQTNLLKQHPQIVNRLRTAFIDWFDDATNGVVYRPIAIPVGHADENPIKIQPSWATWTGSHINYTFDGYDWDTIDGWKEPGETATWRLDVVEEGRYSVVLRYGCRPLDAGGVLRLNCGKSSIEHTVMPTTTAEQFERFEVGELVLDRGESVLKAEVISAAGRELMRLNEIELGIVSHSALKAKGP